MRDHLALGAQLDASERTAELLTSQLHVLRGLVTQEQWELNVAPEVVALLTRKTK